ncbi:unnamed protein product [Brassica oleracea]
MYEEHLMRARLWFPIPSVIVEFLNRLEVSISQISPRGIMHLVGLLVLGYERGIELTAEYLEAFLALSRVGTDRLYGFRLRTFMEVLKRFSQGDRGRKSYFFYVRLDQASCTTPFLLFRKICALSETCSVVARCFGGYFSPERVRAAVETYRSRFSLSIDDDMGVFFEVTSLHAVFATGQSSGQRLPDAEDDAEPTVAIGWTDPLWSYLYLPGLAVGGFESLTALRGFIYMMNISCLEMFKTRALGLGQDLGLLSVKLCAVTSQRSFFLLRFLPDSYRFKVRDRFSAYMTCTVRIEHLLRGNF